MKLFFKILFKGIYNFFKNPNEREFLRLVRKYGDAKRYERTEINFLNYKILAVDCLSFIWQFKEIFVEESYKFKSDSSESAYNRLRGQHRSDGIIFQEDPSGRKDYGF